MDKIKLDVTSHGDLTSQPWEDGWDAIHGLAAAVREGVISDDSRVEGKLRVSVASRSEVAAINERFGDVVEVDESLVQWEQKYAMEFMMSKVGASSLFTPASLKNVTSVGTWFNNNKQIESFDEFALTGVTSLPVGAFNRCTNLKKIDLSNIVYMGVNGYHGGGQFTLCTNLEGLIRMPKVKVISGHYGDSGAGGGENYQGAFSGCSNIEAFLATSLEYIDWSAFSGCNKLTEFMMPDVPPTPISETPAPPSQMTLYVRTQSAKNAYDAHDWWKNYSSRIVVEASKFN